MKITFYSTGCVKCKILEQKLKEKNVDYEVCNDVDVMTKKGMLSAPALEVDGNMMMYAAAVNWVNGLEV